MSQQRRCVFAGNAPNKVRMERDYMIATQNSTLMITKRKQITTEISPWNGQQEHWVDGRPGWVGLGGGLKLILRWAFNHCP